MFHHIRGTLTEKQPQHAVVEAGGVGYLMLVPFSTYQSLPAAGKPVTLLAHLHVTENAHTLYGFATERERRFFRQLIDHVKGVGPRVALAILGGGALDHVLQAIRLGDVATLKAIKGVGEATAKRIVLELGKILVQESKKDGSPAKGAKAKASADLGGVLAHLDEMTELAVRAVAQLSEVSPDVALRAVQRALDEMRTQKIKPKAVQDLITRALPLVE